MDEEKIVNKAPAEEAPLEIEAPPAKEPRKPVVPKITKLKKMIEEDNDLVTAEMPGEAQRLEIKKMEKAIANHSICYGRVIGVEIANNTDVRVIVKRETIRIIIPAEDFFFYSPMKDIDKANRIEKFTRYRRKASHMFNAAISFIPLGMDYDQNGVPFIVASRRASMAAIRERHFFADNADVVEGSVAKASIISVGPRYVYVECLGVEAVIGTGGLSAFSYIEDASLEFHTGEGLIVAVEKLDVDKENKEIKEIVFSHSLVERLQAKVETVSDKMIGGRYGATVMAVLPEYYIVMVTGLKIRGVVRVSDGYVGLDPLVPGDTVSLLVSNISEEKNLVYGKCMKTNS